MGVDVDGGVVDVLDHRRPSHGSLLLDAVGGFLYVPAAGFHGVDGFTYVANDGSLDSNVATVTLTVLDVTPPALSLPPTQTFEATGPGGAVVRYTGVLATDSSGPVTIEYSLPNDSLFPLGRTTVHVTARDTARNIAEGDFDVLVVDTTSPTGSLEIDRGGTTTSDGSVDVRVDFDDAVGPVRMRFTTDGGATWTPWEPYGTTRALVLTGPDGLRSVLVEVADGAGNVGSATDAIMLAVPPPTIVVTGITPGQSCNLCSRYPVSITATAPAAAGAVSVVATLDGKPFALNGKIDPFYLKAGLHTLRVVARDAHGRESVQVVTFTVVVTIEGLICAVQRAVTEGLVAPELETSLIAKLEAARASRDRGNTTAEVKQLEAFIQQLAAQRGKKVEPTFADLATGWTEDLITRIGRGAAGPAMKPPTSVAALTRPAPARGVARAAETLPATGADVSGILIAGFALLLVGMGLLLSARPRQAPGQPMSGTATSRSAAPARGKASTGRPVQEIRGRGSGARSHGPPRRR